MNEWMNRKKMMKTKIYIQWVEYNKFFVLRTKNNCSFRSGNNAFLHVRLYGRLRWREQANHILVSFYCYINILYVPLLSFFLSSLLLLLLYTHGVCIVARVHSINSFVSGGTFARSFLHSFIDIYISYAMQDVDKCLAHFSAYQRSIYTATECTSCTCVKRKQITHYYYLSSTHIEYCYFSDYLLLYTES